MNTDQGPGLANQARVRTQARVLSVFLLVVGVVLLVLGIRAFAGSMDDIANPLAPSGFEAVLLMGGGGFCIVFGLAAANVGWMGAGARYVAGETMPVIKESIDQLRAGPFCRACGNRADDDAKFCDGCGQSLS